MNSFLKSLKRLIRETVLRFYYPSYVVTYDKKATVQQLLQDGEYDLVDKKFLSEVCPHLKSGEGLERVRIFLVNLGIEETRDAYLKKLKEKWLRPCATQELLVLGAFYPDLQRKSWIVALDPVLAEDEVTPYLIGGKTTRNVCVLRTPKSKIWDFAAVVMD